jgi:GAF domain-containing protein
MTVLDRCREDLRTARTRQDALEAVVTRLRESVPKYSWVGIYLVEGSDLVLSAWSGEEETEHTRIPLGQGVCGLAASSGETTVVPDVSRDDRYLMCFASTRSEAVVPIWKGGKVVGEIDVDSDQLDAFSEEDEATLEAVAALLSERL